MNLLGNIVYLVIGMFIGAAMAIFIFALASTSDDNTDYDDREQEEYLRELEEERKRSQYEP